MEKQSIQMTVNGQKYEFLIGEKFGMIPPSETLVQTLRKRLELTGTKESCDEGACGCCTVIIDGKAVASCMVLTVECDGSDILTIEGLENPETHELDPIQQMLFLPVRLLHAGHHHERQSALYEKPASHGRTDPRSARGQLLPLHQPLHRAGGAGQAGGR